MSGPFASVWNATYETLPPDTEAESLGASRIRTFKTDIRERMQVDHSLNGDASDGYHNQVSLLISAADPSGSPASGTLAYLYSKVVSGNQELFWKDSSGNVLQLTAGGVIQTFPSGTKMLFRQASAPLGWTQDVAVNDQVIRVVSGAGGGTGGSWSIGGTTITIAGHALSLSEMPNHDHNLTISGSARQIPDFNATPATNAAGAGANYGVFTPQAQGSGASHTHAGSTFSNDGTWRPAYADVICASKN